MTPDRWPKQVREMAAAIVIACHGEDVAVEVKQLVTSDDSAHFGWVIEASCPPIFNAARWQIIGWPPPDVAVPQPAWYAKLNDLPPGSTL